MPSNYFRKLVIEILLVDGEEPERINHDSVIDAVTRAVSDYEDKAFVYNWELSTATIVVAP